MKLDLIFSVGPACRPAYHLKTNYLRSFACPLDWQMDYSLDTCLHLFRTGFQTFFAQIREDTAKKGAHDNRRIIDTSNSITSIHHFDSHITIQEAQKRFRSVMEKRYGQLHAAILNARSVGLICNRDEPLAALASFILSFGQIYPDTRFLLINIRNDRQADRISMSEHIIDHRISIREYSFHDECMDEESMDGNAWIGNAGAWDHILADYCIAHHPLAERAQKAAAVQQPIHLYGAGTYCRKLIRFLARYGLEISDIIVSSMEDNPDSVEGIPVLMFDHIAERYCNDLIIISVTDPGASSAIKTLLEAHGFDAVIRIDPLLRPIC